jgi:hypothetical protein
MGIIKTDHILQEVRLSFDDAGEVVDATLVVSYSLKDDVTNEVVTSVGQGKSVWASLTLAQRTATNTLGKRFKLLAGTF